MRALLKRAVKATLPLRYQRRLFAAYRAIRTLRHRGTSVTCPCCAGSFARFVSYDGVPAIACPRCGSLPRQRLLWFYLRDRTNLLHGEPLRLLHVAPEEVYRRWFSAHPNVRYTSLDLDSPLAAVHADLQRLPFADGAFDAILCSHVLEHVADDRAAMREVARVLRPGGWAILQVPIDTGRARTYEDPTITRPEDRARAFGRYDHVRLYGRDYVARLEEAGMRVEVDGFVRTLGDETICRYGLDPTEDIYRCTRPA